MLLLDGAISLDHYSKIIMLSESDNIATYKIIHNPAVFMFLEDDIAI